MWLWILVACSGGDGDTQEDANPDDDGLAEVSETQQAFLDLRGLPVAYMGTFTEDDDGPRRLDSWVWSDRVAVFDSGYFVSEQRLETSVQAGAMLPSQVLKLHAGSTEAELEQWLGAPEPTAEVPVLDLATLQTVAYEKYAARVTRYDGAIVSISAGMEVRP